jgi:SAM-dependent methyltransferase
MAAWSAAHADVWDGVLDQILAVQPQAASLLDVGAGSGGFLARARARLPRLELAAVEPNGPARTALARRFPGLTFPADSAERLDAGTSSFDVVTILQTLEHLQDPLAACRGALARLREGGLLFVTVPNRRSLAVLCRGRAAGCYANGTHLQFFAWSGLAALLHRAGFVQVRRLAGFGGGQHRRFLPNLAQFIVRRLGCSTEVRAVGRKP